MSEHEQRRSSGEASTASSWSDAKDVPLQSLRRQLVQLAIVRQELDDLQNSAANSEQSLHQLLQRHQKAKEQAHAISKIKARTQAHVKRAELTNQRITETKRKAVLSRRILAAQAQALIRAGTCMQVAERRLREARKLLEGPEGVGRWLQVRDKVVMRRCLLTKALGDIYQIGPKIVSEIPCGGLLDERMDWSWWLGVDVGLSDEDSVSSLGGISSSTRDSNGGRGLSYREVAKLVICDLEVPSSIGRRGFDYDKESFRKQCDDVHTSAALGFIAHVVEKMGFYLDVPARYPVKFRNSKSIISDQHPPLAHRLSNHFDEEQFAQRYDHMFSGDTTGWQVVRSEDGWRPAGDHAESPIQFPLWYEGQEATRFAYATFLLSKDIEQLLVSHGLTPMGPAHMLHNLHKLIMLAGSAVPG